VCNVSFHGGGEKYLMIFFTKKTIDEHWKVVTGLSPTLMTCLHNCKILDYGLICRYNPKWGLVFVEKTLFLTLRT
jgi:hypothetical protein